jgi:hypothetical protein
MTQRQRHAKNCRADQQDQQRPATGKPGVGSALTKCASNLASPLPARGFQRLVAPFGSFAPLLPLGLADRARVSLVRLVGRARTGLS